MAFQWKTAMRTVLAHLQVDPNGQVTGQVPRDVPTGDYTAPLEVPEQRGPKASTKLDLPLHDEPWDDAVSLRREDLYGPDRR